MTEEERYKLAAAVQGEVALVTSLNSMKQFEVDDTVCMADGNKYYAEVRHTDEIQRKNFD